MHILTFKSRASASANFAILICPLTIGSIYNDAEDINSLDLPGVRNNNELKSACYHDEEAPYRMGSLKRTMTEKFKNQRKKIIGRQDKKIFDGEPVFTGGLRRS